MKDLEPENLIQKIKEIHTGQYLFDSLNISNANTNHSFTGDFINN